MNFSGFSEAEMLQSIEGIEGETLTVTQICTLYVISTTNVSMFCAYGLNHKLCD